MTEQKKPNRLNQLELVEIMIEKKTRVDPNTIYKKIKNMN